MTFIFKNIFNALKSSVFSVPTVLAEKSVTVSMVPCRTKYIDNRMIRDVKRRKVVKEYAKLRLQLNALRYNTILPKKLQEEADKEISALPLNSWLPRIHARCVLTSRARGRWRRFRMSRIIWRHLADYNQISGAERAMWGHTKAFFH